MPVEAACLTRRPQVVPRRRSRQETKCLWLECDDRYEHVTQKGALKDRLAYKSLLQDDAEV